MIRSSAATAPDLEKSMTRDISWNWNKKYQGSGNEHDTNNKEMGGTGAGTGTGRGAGRGARGARGARGGDDIGMVRGVGVLAVWACGPVSPIRHPASSDRMSRVHVISCHGHVLDDHAS